MSHSITAIFDSGVFRPLEPVELADGTQVRIQMPQSDKSSASGSSPEELAAQQAAINKMLTEIENLPVQEPDDGFSGRDHDKVLYGGR